MSKKILLIKVMQNTIGPVFSTNLYYSASKPDVQNVIDGIYIIGEGIGKNIGLGAIPLLGYCDYYDGIIKGIQPGDYHTAFQNVAKQNWIYEWDLKNLTPVNHVFDLAHFLSKHNSDGKNLSDYLNEIHVFGYLDVDDIATELLVNTEMITPFKGGYTVGDIIPELMRRIPGKGLVSFKNVPIVDVEDEYDSKTGVTVDQKVWVELPEVGKVQYSAKDLRERNK